jgi:hypothetical protein
MSDFSEETLKGSSTAWNVIYEAMRVKFTMSAMLSFKINEEMKILRTNTN